MIKKAIALVVLAMLFAGSCYGFNLDWYGGDGGSSCEDCPTITGDLTFCFDGEEADSKDALAASGSLNGTLNDGATMNTTDPICGTADLEVTNANDWLQHTLVNNTDIDGAVGTAIIEFIPSSTAGTTNLWGRIVSATQRVYALFYSSGVVFFRHQATSGTDVTVTTSASLNDGEKNTVYLAWSVASNQIAVKINDGAWENDSDADTVTDMNIGGANRIGGATIAQASNYDRVRIYSTYKKVP